MGHRALLALSVIFFAGFAPPAAPPVVIELFTSEGCSSCPPADALLQRLAAAADVRSPVIALGEHVDYWDHQGWKDRFSSTAFTRRQQLYAARFNADDIYTPQMVVDGRIEFVGSDAAAARRAIERAAAVPHGVVSIAIEGNRAPERPALHSDPAASAVTAVARPFLDRVSLTVTASSLPPQHERADLIVAVTENGLTSNVTRGENRGRVLSHTAVVRTLIVVGDASGADASAHAEVDIGSDWASDRLTVVGFVQERRNRTILAASAVPLVPRP